MLIGLHVSIAGSIDQAVERASLLRCSTFQIFTRNPRGWKYSDLDPVIIRNFREKAAQAGFTCIVGHMPYLPNLASPDRETYQKSVETLKAEFERCGSLGISCLVVHLGSHMGSGISNGIERVANACDSVLQEIDNDVMLLLENTAGTRNSVGSTFENLRAILDQIDRKNRVGVCFDTCHAFATGYDLRTKVGNNRIFAEFDRILGKDRIKVIHMNDSRGPLGCGSDRHEHIGLGSIGENGLRILLRDKRFKGLPFILETPIDKRGDDRRNMAKVHLLAGLTYGKT